MISSSATACPKCGDPVAESPPGPADPTLRLPDVAPIPASVAVPLQEFAAPLPNSIAQVACELQLAGEIGSAPPWNAGQLTLTQAGLFFAKTTNDAAQPMRLASLVGLRSVVNTSNDGSESASFRAGGSTYQARGQGVANFCGAMAAAIGAPLPSTGSGVASSGPFKLTPLRIILLVVLGLAIGGVGIFLKGPRPVRIPPTEQALMRFIESIGGEKTPLYVNGERSGVFFFVEDGVLTGCVTDSIASCKADALTAMLAPNERIKPIGFAPKMHCAGHAGPAAGVTNMQPVRLICVATEPMTGLAEDGNFRSDYSLEPNQVFYIQGDVASIRSGRMALYTLEP